MAGVNQPAGKPRPSQARQALGRWGEAFAADYLIGLGYSLLEKNARTPYGEIDLVACLGDVTIFVEVKTRTSRSFGLPEDAITRRKRKHMLDCAQAYIQNHPELGGDWRLDVIAIERLDPAGPPDLVHFEDVLHEDE